MKSISIFAAIAVLVCFGAVSAHADDWRDHEDHAREWHRHHRHERDHGRPVVIERQPDVVFAPPLVVEPPQIEEPQNSGFNLIFPINIK